MNRRIGVAPAAALTAAVLFVGWTWLTLHTDALARLDAAHRCPGSGSAWAGGQILAAPAQ